MSSRPAELRKIEANDLQREIAEKQSQAMKMRLGLQAGSEKDSSKHRRMKREIARSLTILNEKRNAGELNKAIKAPKVSAPHQAARPASSGHEANPSRATRKVRGSSSKS